MARQRRVPVVGSKQLHPVQISPEIRRIEARRTKAAARREAAPILNADRRAFGEANREYSTQARSVRGATHMVEGALAQALAGLKGSGLSGRYLRQTQNEFTSRQADAASAIPALLAGAQEERGKALREASTQLASDRANMQQDAAQAFDQRLKELRGQGSTALKGGAENTGSSSRSLHIALMTAISGYQELLASSGKWFKGKTEVDPGTEGAREIHPPRTESEWRAFALQVAKTEGADPIDAANAVKILRERINRKVKKGNLKPLGIVLHPGTTSG